MFHIIFISIPSLSRSPKLCNLNPCVFKLSLSESIYIYLQLSEKFQDSKMNPLTQTLNQLKMNEKELAAGVSGTKSSWHTEYKDSAWIFLGGLPYEMTEGDR